MIKKTYFLYFIFTASLICIFASCSNKKPTGDLKINNDSIPKKQTTEIRDYKSYYDEYGVEGSFSMYDMKGDKYVLYNPEQFKIEFTPASTFKICNSLIGLETGVIPDKNFVIKWDGTKRENEAWNKDTDLKTAFKNSTVWYYQELARRVGGEKMFYWLNKVSYGNKDTSGGIDKFWLNGRLRISPEQQIDFLKRLYRNELPFSQRAMDITKKIMIAEDTLGYILRAKTGWGGQDNKDIGWYVGYLTKGDSVYFFANCVQNSDMNNKKFVQSRIEITKKIFKQMGLI